MSSRALTQWLAAGLFLMVVVAGVVPVAHGQDQEVARKVKNKVAPIYPELARRMSITGIVKVQITVDKNGAIKNPKLVGGHPILANAALDAVRKWRYEAAAEETTGIVEFRFDPQ